jgi:hypothetical protein
MVLFFLTLAVGLVCIAWMVRQVLATFRKD